MKRHLCLSILLLALVPLSGTALSPIEVHSYSGSMISAACSQAAPILTSLEVVPHPQGNRLQWEAGMPAAYYFVERSVNGEPFMLTGGIRAVPDHPSHLYQYIERLKVYGEVKYYDYRIQVEFADGSRRYSEVVRVYPAKAERLRISAKPEGSAPGVRLHLEDQPRNPELKFEVYDMQGHMVYQAPLSNRQASWPRDLSFPPLRSGLYLFRLSDGSQQWFGRAFLD